MAVACDSASNQGAAQTATASRSDSLMMTADSIEVLPLPIIPSNIQDRRQRADYMVAHFWDALNFNDTLRTHNRDFLEQNFANYASLFPIIDTGILKVNVSRFVDRVKGDATALNLLAEVVEKYLYDPNSPMLNENFYELFIPSFLSAEKLNLATREKLKDQLVSIAKNRVGQLATDFAYTDRQGVRRTLMTTNVSSYLWLIFFDPDCDDCKNIIRGMKQSPELKEMVDNGLVTVLAIGAVGEEKDIRHAIDDFPASWLAGVDKSGIDDRELYDLRAMPTIYLLSPDHRVVKKDILFPSAISFLASQFTR